MNANELPVAVIGGGPVGLAAAAHLGFHLGIAFLVLGFVLDHFLGHHEVPVVPPELVAIIEGGEHHHGKADEHYYPKSRLRQKHPHARRVDGTVKDRVMENLGNDPVGQRDHDHELDRGDTRGHGAAKGEDTLETRERIEPGPVNPPSKRVEKVSKFSLFWAFRVIFS